MKPRVFIGSSSEGLSVGYALQVNLEQDAEVTVWTQDCFRPTEFTLESLLKELGASDAGIFVFTADDIVTIRGAEFAAVRDNVIFELGLYIGSLGRSQSFIVAPRSGNPRLPSDLLGVTVLTFDAGRADGRLEAALGPASHRIRTSLKDIEPAARSLPAELRRPILERRGLLSGRQLAILEAVEKKGPISETAITSVFPDVPAPEMHYRLEQLRLLQFIVMEEAEGRPEMLALHPAYSRALPHLRPLRTDD
jgi:hypothetical protein